MPFIGKQPSTGFSSIAKDDFTPDGSTTAFTLSRAAASANDVAVFVGNVRQEPTDAYSVSGTTLTMTSAPASGVNFYALHLGTVESTTVPAAGTTVPGNFDVAGTLSTDGITSSDQIILDNNRGLQIKNSNGDIGTVVYGTGAAADEIRMGDYNNRFSNGLVLMTASTNRIRVNNSGNTIIPGGICLGTANADTYSAANNLDDYEEGTWTPDVSGATWSATPWSVQGGSYTKVGRTVTCEFVLFAKTSTFPTLSSDGNLTFTGLPFTHNANYSPSETRVWIPLHTIQRLANSREDQKIAIELGASTSGLLRVINTGSLYQSILQGSEIYSDGRISGTFSYFTDS